MKINQERYNELLEGNIVIRNDYTDKSIKLINELWFYNKSTLLRCTIVGKEKYYVVVHRQLIGINNLNEIYHYYKKNKPNRQVQNPDWFFEKTNTSILL